MADDKYIESLESELNHFREEKEKVRQILGSIGGVDDEKRDRLITIVFAVIILSLFSLDLLHHVFHIPLPVPPLFSIAVGVFLVSVKIMLMMHGQTKIYHFQFWILNSIEFRLTDISKRIAQLEQAMKPKE